MTFLLGQRGYDARSGLSLNALFADVEKSRPDVLVLAESHSFADTVGLAVQVLGLSDTVSVVVATSRHDAPATNRLRFVDRWASFDVLAEAVERAWAELPPVAVR
jgi:FixJ family two-component response regulator